MAVDMNARQTRLQAERAAILTRLTTEQAWEDALQAYRAQQKASPVTLPPYCTTEVRHLREIALRDARADLIAKDTELAALI